MATFDGSSLEAFLVQAGTVTTGELSSGLLDSLVAGALADLERDTGWKPFLAATRTLSFDGPVTGRWYVPGTGLLSVASLTLDDDALTEGTNFVLRPEVCKVTGLPYRWIDFDRVSGTTNGLEITGSFGRQTTLSDDVVAALHAHAGSLYLTQVEGSSGAGVVKREKQGPIEYEYDTAEAAGADATIKGWEAHYRFVVSRYSRTNVA